MRDSVILALVDDLERRIPVVEKGDKGDSGDQGDRGPRGFPGMDGQDGSDGPPGTRGPSGIDGRNGADGRPGRPGKDGTSVERAVAETLPAGRDATAQFNPQTGLLKLGIPRGMQGPPGQTWYGGGGGGSAAHPSLAGHDTLGLATDAEMTAAIAAAIATHAATSHGGDVPPEIGITL